MDRIKDLKTPELERIFNTMRYMLDANIPCDEETAEALRQELVLRGEKSIQERIAWTIMSHKSITHTKLLQTYSRYAKADDIGEGISSLLELGEIYIEYGKKKGKTYIWKDAIINPDINISS